MGFVADFVVGSKEASNTKDIADRNLDITERIYNDSVAREEPFRQSALGALGQRDALLGLGGSNQVQSSQNNGVGNYGGFSNEAYSARDGVYGQLARGPDLTQGYVQSPTYGQSSTPTVSSTQAAPTQNSGDQGFYDSLFYRAPFDEGQGAIEGGAASRGGLLTGQTAKDVINYGQNQGGNNFLNYFNAINNAAGQGQVSNQSLNASGQNYSIGAQNANNQYLQGQNQGLSNIGQGIDGGLSTLSSLFGGF